MPRPEADGATGQRAPGQTSASGANPQAETSVNQIAGAPRAAPDVEVAEPAGRAPALQSDPARPSGPSVQSGPFAGDQSATAASGQKVANQAAGTPPLAEVPPAAQPSAPRRTSLSQSPAATAPVAPLAAPTSPQPPLSGPFYAGPDIAGPAGQVTGGPDAVAPPRDPEILAQTSQAEAIRHAPAKSSQPSDILKPGTGSPAELVLQPLPDTGQVTEKGAADPLLTDRVLGDAPSRSEPIQAKGPDLPRPALAQFAETLRTAPGVVDVTLRPDELGRLTLNMATQDGTITVTVTAERPETLELLRRNADLLLAEARAAGFDQVDLSFSSHGGSPGERSHESDNGPHPLAAVPVQQPERFADSPTARAQATGRLDIRL